MGDGKPFENEVRRIARLLWPSAEFGGARMEDGQERDGVFETDEFVHIIECTTSRSKQKAEDDLKKLEKLIRKIGARYPQKFVKGWFVTQDEPTAEQRSVFRNVLGRIVPVSFDQFRSRLVDAKSYLSARKEYPFGSVRDPESGAARIHIDYVPLDIVAADGSLYSAQELSKTLVAGNRYIMLGDYGAGKSSTIREAFFKTSASFSKGDTILFPIALNLRDHHGQVDPVEAIERHARQVGFPKPADLVRAWRGGFAVLLLDGFDEIATAGWAGKTKRLRDLRFKSMELLRSFVRDTPPTVGMVITGRAHFFDSPKEMIDSLGASNRFEILNLSEFNEVQTKCYLAKQGWDDPVPEWVPARPLLLGYLASRGLLAQTLVVDAGSGAAMGWNALIKRISEREAEIEAGIDSGTVRRLLGHLAVLARNTVDGLGPLSAEQITRAFEVQCGYPPDDRGIVLLQRLPGLGGHSAQDGSRVFIDKDFADAAVGGTITEFLEDPYSQNLDAKDWQSALSPLASQVAALGARARGLGSGKFSAALHRIDTLPRSDTLRADVVLTMIAAKMGYDGADLFIRDVIIPELCLEDAEFTLANVHFQDCMIGQLELSTDRESETWPRFSSCFFGLVNGRTGPDDMPTSVFSDCFFEEFENPARTTKDILDLGLPVSTKVLLTVLKKLFAQRGSGRRESALFRGLDARTRELVPDALALLRKHGFVIRSRQGEQVVWLPTRGSEYRRRALGMLAAPNGSSDPVLVESMNN